MLGLPYIYSASYEDKGKGQGKGKGAKQRANICSWYQFAESLFKIQHWENKENGRVVKKKRNSNVVKLLKTLSDFSNVA